MERYKKNLKTSFCEWARDWRALALTQVHHWSRLSDSREDGEALSSVHEKKIFTLLFFLLGAANMTG